MLIPLGILAASSAAGGSYELIETITVGSGGAASVTFSNLNTYSTTYQHLQIRAVVRTAVSEAASQIGLQINGDTSSSSYAFHQLYGNGSSVGSEGYGTGTLGMITPVVRTFGATGTSNAFGAGVIDLLDAYESKNKTVRALHGGAGVSHIGLTSGVWLNTAAISSVTLLKQGGGNLAQYSRFSIYGLKASA